MRRLLTGFLALFLMSGALNAAATKDPRPEVGDIPKNEAEPGSLTGAGAPKPAPSESAGVKNRDGSMSSGHRPMIAAISPSALWRAFDENEVAAEDEYRGKEVVITGIVKDIAASPIRNIPQVSFTTDEHGFKSVQCEFAPEDRQEVGRIRKGQSVTLAGICREMSVGAIYLEKCRIVD